MTKASVLRLAFAQGHEPAPHGATAVALTPGRLRSEMMLDNYSVTEDTWREAADPDCRRSLVEVQDRGRPANADGYR